MHFSAFFIIDVALVVAGLSAWAATWAWPRIFIAMKRIFFILYFLFIFSSPPEIYREGACQRRCHISPFLVNSTQTLSSRNVALLAMAISAFFSKYKGYLYGEGWRLAEVMESILSEILRLETLLYSVTKELTGTSCYESFNDSLLQNLVDTCLQVFFGIFLGFLNDCKPDLLSTVANRLSMITSPDSLK